MSQHLHLARPFRGDAAGFVAQRGGDGIQIDHRASMDLLEAIARQLREQLLQRCADQRLSLARRYEGVLVGGLEVADLVKRNHPDRVARASANDA